MFERDDFLLCKRFYDPNRELILVPAEIITTMIWYLNEGPGGAHLAAKTTLENIICTFYLTSLKNNARFGFASCPAFLNYLRLGRTLIAGLRPLKVGKRENCLAVDIVGKKDLLSKTSRSNSCILTIINFFTRYAVDVSLHIKLHISSFMRYLFLKSVFTVLIDAF